MTTTFTTLSAAHAALAALGFSSRDNGRLVWRRPGFVATIRGVSIYVGTVTVTVSEDVA
jgi:hypothetical protein